MNCWTLLGIAPTGDTEAIKKAFAEQSKLHHPEEDPDGFKQLRDAYRQALNEAKHRPEAFFDARVTMAESDAPEGTAFDPETVIHAEKLDFSEVNTRAEPVDEAGGKASYNFGSVECIEVPEESYYPSTFASQPTGLPKHIQRQRKLLKAKNTLITPRFKRSGIFLLLMAVFFIYRLASAVNKLQPPPPNQSSILTISDFSAVNTETIRKLAETIWQDQSENRSEREKEFVQTQILPAIKFGIMNSRYFIIALEFGSMVGMSYDDLIRIQLQYTDDHSEKNLDRNLMLYDHLVAPNGWAFYSQ